ncbi:MAG TPA: FliM/FliN family flagellar motor switch protein [Mycobacteriales bacterium]|nr:FliM/FliN family flagellar motor switch protein [Mycobacteriales bacterium]
MADAAVATSSSPRVSGRVPVLGAPRERPLGAPAYVPPAPAPELPAPAPAPAVTPFGAARPLPADAAALVTRLQSGFTISGLRLAHLLRAPLRLDWHGVTRIPATAAADGMVLPLAAGTVGGALVLDAGCARTLADLSLGGNGRSTESPIPVALAVVARHLSAAFAPLSDIAGGTPGPLPVEPPADRGLPATLRGADVVAAAASLVLGDEPIGSISLLLSARPVLGGEPAEAGPDRPSLAAVPVTVAVQLPARTISALDASHLEAGDVIPMNLATTTVIGLLDGTPVMTGSLGRAHGHRAVLVETLALEAS